MILHKGIIFLVLSFSNELEKSRLGMMMMMIIMIIIIIIVIIIIRIRIMEYSVVYPFSNDTRVNKFQRVKQNTAVFPPPCENLMPRSPST